MPRGSSLVKVKHVHVGPPGGLQLAVAHVGIEAADPAGETLVDKTAEKIDGAWEPRGDLVTDAFEADEPMGDFLAFHHLVQRLGTEELGVGGDAKPFVGHNLVFLAVQE